MKFRIDYRIDEAEWASTTELRSDRESHPIFDAFYGDISISANGHNLFQFDDIDDPHSLNMSVADLAVQLTQMLLDGFPYRDEWELELLWRTKPEFRGRYSDSSRFMFRQGDDAWEVYFQLVEDDIIVTYNKPDTGEIAVEARIFSQGVYEFLKRFVAEIKVKVPDVFEWKDLRILADIDRVITHHEQMAVRR